ncbi:MAG: hypothetical protein Q7U35_08530 [Methanobacteriaceae archaeon]|jgi:hypothetical protein|nr:hypothetical protein [Methanobacteriaceae archaeon]MDP2836186.1 hypothetical protein [Methanobacteriaceae archaeon]MDP3035922.1 hypothetical protein [Methanobacteriaceae archaeon]MDP3484715.1 hypothetical protein [Methanobacteriaceae archaeon]MDP3624650.1 hypothetical protein [Methanobacteriaceae archaeon]
MTPLEFLVILALVAVLAVLLYSYLQNNRELNLGRVKSDATGLGQRVYGEASDFGGKVQGGASNLGEKVSGEGTMSGMSEKLNVSGVSEKVSGVGEKVSDMGGKIKDKVSTSSSTDDLSERIDLFMSEKSDQMIEDWELATKNDITGLEKRFETATKNIGDLEKKFDEYRGSTNNKLEKIEERLEKLETPEE